MTSGALEPDLTPYDRRVLRALPAAGVGRVTVWHVGEELGELDLVMLEGVLHGLRHFGYADCSVGRPTRWCRLRDA